jgi:uncharacterized spore protein YtfJ
MMADFDIGGFMKDVVSGLATLTETVQVIGQPVEVGGKIVIPAVVTRMAFGAGGGGGSTPADQPGERESGSGGGGGGGVQMTPVFLVVDDEGERLLTVSGPLDRACSMLEKAKEALDRVVPRKEPCGSVEAEIDAELGDFEDTTPGRGPAY